MTDRDLIDRYRAGELVAFETLVTRYERPLLQYVGRYAPGIAEDVVQETFLRLAREARELNGIESLAAWLYRVARNVAVDELRKEKRMQERHRAASTLRRASADCPLAGIETAEAVHAAISRLPAKQRQVLVLKLHEQKTYREISAATGHTVGHVGYLMHHGLKSLARDLRQRGLV